MRINFPAIRRDGYNYQRPEKTKKGQGLGFISDLLTAWLCFMGSLAALCGIISFFPGKIAELYLISVEFTIIPKLVGISFYLLIAIISFRIRRNIKRMGEKYSIEG